MDPGLCCCVLTFALAIPGSAIVENGWERARILKLPAARILCVDSYDRGETVLMGLVPTDRESHATVELWRRGEDGLRLVTRIALPGRPVQVNLMQGGVQALVLLEGCVTEVPSAGQPALELSRLLVRADFTTGRLSLVKECVDRCDLSPDRKRLVIVSFGLSGAIHACSQFIVGSTLSPNPSDWPHALVNLNRTRAFPYTTPVWSASGERIAFGMMFSDVGDSDGVQSTVQSIMEAIMRGLAAAYPQEHKNRELLAALERSIRRLGSNELGSRIAVAVAVAQPRVADEEEDSDLPGRWLLSEHLRASGSWAEGKYYEPIGLDEQQELLYLLSRNQKVTQDGASYDGIFVLNLRDQSLKLVVGDRYDDEESFNRRVRVPVPVTARACPSLRRIVFAECDLFRGQYLDERLRIVETDGSATTDLGLTVTGDHRRTRVSWESDDSFLVGVGDSLWRFTHQSHGTLEKNPE